MSAWQPQNASFESFSRAKDQRAGSDGASPLLPDDQWGISEADWSKLCGFNKGTRHITLLFRFLSKQLQMTTLKREPNIAKSRWDQDSTIIVQHIHLDSIAVLIVLVTAHETSVVRKASAFDGEKAMYFSECSQHPIVDKSNRSVQ